MGKRKRWYSDADKVYAVRTARSSGQSIRAVARQLGIPVPTLHKWLTGQASAYHINAYGNRPLKAGDLWHFRDRRPVVIADPKKAVYVDPARLSADERARLTELIDRARVDPPSA